MKKEKKTYERHVRAADHIQSQSDRLFRDFDKAISSGDDGT
jgi:hypothetical protein